MTLSNPYPPIPNLLTLSQSEVSQFIALLTTAIEAYNPAIDLRTGAVQSNVLQLKGVLDAATQVNIDLIRQGNSVLQATTNPSLADPTILAAALSNFGVTKNLGTVASGNITIVLSQLIGVIIPNGSQFTISGQTFQTTAAYAARTSASAVVATTDVLITTLPNGTFIFNIPVTAVTVGSIGNVTAGTAVTPLSPPPKFLSSYVAADFSGGTDVDTNQALLNKLATGMAIKSWGNRLASFGLIKKQTAFANVRNVSIIGFGDGEMLRDQHSLWAGSMGGRCDIYLRSQALYQNVTLSKTATLISRSGAVGTWQFGIGKNDAAGFYQVTNILLPATPLTITQFTPSSDVRAIDMTGVINPPDIVNLTEGIYSRYQAATIQFVDTVTDATSLVIGTSTKTYNVVCQIMPLVDQVQDFLMQRDVGPNMSDIVVKAPVPCYTTLSLTLNYVSGTTPPTVASVQNTIANGINGLDWAGSISTSFLSTLLHNAYTNTVSITAVTLNGSIRRPDATVVNITDPATLNVPNDPSHYVTGRTVAFYCQPTGVTVTLNPVVTPIV